MNNLEFEQKYQEDLYKFPYHHLTTYENNNFSQTKKNRWGYEYISFVRFVLKQINNLQFDSLLDVGCGEGKLLQEIYKFFPGKKLIGLDFSERAIGFARAFNPSIEFIKGDIRDQTIFNHKFDTITLVEVLEHIPLKQVHGFVKSLSFYLSDQGTLIITVPTDKVSLPPKHYQHFNFDSLNKALYPHFKVNQHFYINRISLKVGLLERLLDNRFFILNQRHLVNLLYHSYEKYLLIGNGKDCKRICVLCSKL